MAREKSTLHSAHTGGLIRHFHPELKRGGGGSGYLYNLQAGLQAATERLASAGLQLDIRALPPPQSLPERPLLQKISRRLARLAGRLDTSSFAERYAHAVRWFDYVFGSLTRTDAEALLQCDFLFVHHVFVAKRLVQLAPSLCRQKVVLMTHAPKYMAHEIANDVEPWADIKALYESPQVRELVKREKEVMHSVHATAWPCQEAEEGYAGWRESTGDGTLNTLCLETGVERPPVLKTRAEQWAAWGIDPKQRVVLFMGRAHPHKGFDRFLDWADFHAATGRRDWAFVYAGREPSAQRSLSSIKCAGYVSDNGSAYAAADLVVIPNRHSYFDIGVLEILSLGARQALSPTGGHKHLLRICPELAIIPEGEGVESTWLALETAADRYAADPEIGQRMKRLWEQRFSAKCLAMNHVKASQQLLSV